MSFINIRGLLAAFTMIVASFGLAAVPALAQSTTTTSPTSPTTSCGTVCPNTSMVSATGISAFGGLLTGSFGTFDANGKVVSGSGITGSVTGTKIGGGDNKVTVDYAGCAAITCGNTQITAKIMGFETGNITVAGTTTMPGQALVLANSGTLAAAAGFTTSWPSLAPKTN
jgi:hypothetical protein